MKDSPYKHRFTHKGQPRTLFNRKLTQDACWYVRITRGERVTVRSLSTADEAQAVEAAKVLIDAADRGDWAVMDQFRSRNKHGATSSLGKFLNQCVMATDCLNQATIWVKAGRSRLEDPRNDQEYACDALDAALLHAQGA